MKLFTGIFNRPRRRPNWNVRDPQAACESLEQRKLLCAASVADGILTIDCGNTDDVVTVTSRTLNFNGMPLQHTTVDCGGSSETFYGAVDGIVFNGNGGDDEFHNETNIPSTLNGGAGNDVLNGGSADDVINGGAGNDFLYGYAGNDELRGGVGNDELYGMTGADVLYGNEGEDSLFGGQGGDHLNGGFDGEEDFIDAGPDDGAVDTIVNYLINNPYADETGDIDYKKEDEVVNNQSNDIEILFDRT